MIRNKFGIKPNEFKELEDELEDELKRLTNEFPNIETEQHLLGRFAEYILDFDTNKILLSKVLPLKDRLPSGGSLGFILSKLNIGLDIGIVGFITNGKVCDIQFEYRTEAGDIRSISILKKELDSTTGVWS